MKVERFTADWCMPCRQFAPVFDKVVEANGLDAMVYDIETPEGSAKAQEYGIKSIPAVFVDGKQIKHTDFEKIDWSA